MWVMLFAKNATDKQVSTVLLALVLYHLVIQLATNASIMLDKHMPVGHLTSNINIELDVPTGCPSSNVDNELDVPTCKYVFNMTRMLLQLV